MIAESSLKLHNKLYFVECDIRTHLTRQMQESRPGTFSGNYFALKDQKGNKTVWGGPDTLEESISAIRKAFAHQLSKFSGIWWFDMWGGWYHSTRLMAEIEKMKSIFENLNNKKEKLLKPETVVFIDEKAYLNNARGSGYCHSMNRIRMAMGNTGIPYDLYMVEDAERVLKNYKSAIFPAPLPSENGEKALSLCKEFGVQCIETNSQKMYYTTNELRERLVSNGVHCYNKDGNVIYCGNGLLAVHTKNDGEVKITLPETCNIKSLQNSVNIDVESNEIILNMAKHETCLFQLSV
jgi:beta-galactosidase